MGCDAARLSSCRWMATVERRPKWKTEVQTDRNSTQTPTGVPYLPLLCPLRTAFIFQLAVMGPFV